MASEIRRMAKALLEERRESFASRHPLAESQARLARALAAVPIRAMRFDTAWRQEHGRVALDIHFSPHERTRRWLQAISVALTLLIACSVWVAFAPEEERPVKVLLPLFTALAVLAMPFMAVALGSRREAEEAQVRRAIRKALLDEDMAPSERRSDED